MLLPASFRTTTALDSLSVKFINDQTKFAALRVLPPKLVPKNAFKWYIYGKEMLKSNNLASPSGTEAPRFDFSATTASGLAKEYASKELVLEKDARDFDIAVADLRVDAAQNNASRLLIAMEDAMVTKVCTSGNYASGLTAASGGLTSNSTDPIEEVRTARQAVFEACGMRPNAIAMNQKSVDLLKNQAAIVDRLKYVGIGVDGMGASGVVKALQSLFELDELIISDVVKNTANDGATDALSSIWGSTAAIFVKNMNPGLRQMAFGSTFMVNNFYSKSIARPELGRDLGAEDLESGWEWAQEFIAQDGSAKAVAGYLLTGLY
jgi:hypothetical protein